MKAVIYNKKAKPDKFLLSEIDTPQPSEDEVLVKIHAVSPNAADYRSMNMGIIPKKKIFGSAIAGVVESVGKDVGQFNRGDEVIGNLADFGFGGFAEFVAVSEEALVRKQQNIDFTVGSAIPVAATTAYQALLKKGALKKGQDVLILGSSGGVGSYAIQFAKYFGATVTAVCSTRNQEQSKSLGADIVVDYTKEDVTKTKNKFDIILAVNGSYSLFTCKSMLKNEGTFVMIGGTIAMIFKSLVFGKILSLGKKNIRSLAAKPNQQDLEFICNLVSEGKVNPLIEKVFSFDQTSEAMKYLASGHARGKIVIKII